jgi:glutathione synthase/RimK-type ligase-like ATP-grasp enzyme
MPRVAFATYRDGPGEADDAPAADALRRAGVDVALAVWDDADVAWAAFDAVVIRSTWDYHLRADEFARWVSTFSTPDSRLWNPPAAVLWNMNKRYLLGLERRGVHVVPTEYVTAADGPHLRSVLARRGWDEAVVKPAYGAGAHGTWRTSLATAEADHARFAQQLATGDLLVQRYMPQVTAGEWSLVFLGGEYSHAVLKRPAGGDFRVHEHLGGTVARAEPGQGLIEQARDAVAAVGQPLPYARVDAVERGGQLVLMELEIIEPSLFLGFAAGAGQRFADALLRATHLLPR